MPQVSVSGPLNSLPKSHEECYDSANVAERAYRSKGIVRLISNNQVVRIRDESGNAAFVFDFKNYTVALSDSVYTMDEIQRNGEIAENSGLDPYTFHLGRALIEFRLCKEYGSKYLVYVNEDEQMFVSKSNSKFYTWERYLRTKIVGGGPVHVKKDRESELVDTSHCIGFRLIDIDGKWAHVKCMTDCVATETATMGYIQWIGDSYDPLIDLGEC